MTELQKVRAYVTLMRLLFWIAFNLLPLIGNDKEKSLTDIYDKFKDGLDEVAVYEQA